MPIPVNSLQLVVFIVAYKPRLEEGKGIEPSGITLARFSRPMCHHDATFRAVGWNRTTLMFKRVYSPPPYQSGYYGVLFSFSLRAAERSTASVLSAEIAAATPAVNKIVAVFASRLVNPSTVTRARPV